MKHRQHLLTFFFLFYFFTFSTLSRTVQIRQHKLTQFLSFLFIYLHSSVKGILARAKRVLEEINFLSDSPRLSASQVPWPLVLDACVNFRLTPLHSDPDLAEQDVYFLVEELNVFDQPPLWRQSAKLSKEEAAKVKSENR